MTAAAERTKGGKVRGVHVSKGDRHVDPDGSTVAPHLQLLGNTEDTPLTRAAQWLDRYLTSGNPDVGRDGPVCPFARAAFTRGDVSWALRRGVAPTLGALAAALRQEQQIFLRLVDGLSPARARLAARMVVFDGSTGASAGPLLDAVQGEVKTDFVRAGLMVSQFHPDCEMPGLWNPDFRPLRAPVAFFAMRVMIAGDLPFLTTPGHRAAHASRFPAPV